MAKTVRLDLQPLQHGYCHRRFNDGTKVDGHVSCMNNEYSMSRRQLDSEH